MFPQPRHEIASEIIRLWDRPGTKVSIVVGFLTTSGYYKIKKPIEKDPDSLEFLVVGAGTDQVFNAFDKLLAQTGLKRDRLLINLGYSRRSNNPADHFRPMMHSKIFLFKTNNYVAAIVGSHNITGFALGGLNAEAAILLEGKPEEEIFEQIEKYLNACALNSRIFRPNEISGYTSWSESFFKAIAAKVTEGQFRKKYQYGTVVVFCFPESNPENEEETIPPKKGDSIYLEIPQVFEQLDTIGTSAHVYILKDKPTSPEAALLMVPKCAKAFEAELKIAGMGSSLTGVKTNWKFDDIHSPTIRAVTSEIRPQDGKIVKNFKTIHVVLDLERNLIERYDYKFEEINQIISYEPEFVNDPAYVDSDPELFDGIIREWSEDLATLQDPITCCLEEDTSVSLLKRDKQIIQKSQKRSEFKKIRSFKEGPKEYDSWYKVKKLNEVPKPESITNAQKEKLKQVFPDQGIFVIFATNKDKLNNIF